MANSYEKLYILIPNNKCMSVCFLKPFFFQILPTNFDETLHLVKLLQNLLDNCLFMTLNFRCFYHFIGHGSQLSIVTVNVILSNCHELKRLGRLDQWGHVDRHQIESIRNEIKARNFDLIIDTGEE